MDLYFSPMACSLASRISLYEAGAKDVQFVEVDPKTKRTMAGTNYFEIYPLGLVPYLRLEDGSALSENAAQGGNASVAFDVPKPPVEIVRYLEDEISSSSQPRLWQAILYATNSFIDAAWSYLPNSEQERFKNEFMSAFMSYRVSIPVENAKLMLEYLKAGKVEFIPGSFNADYGRDGQTHKVTMRDGSLRRYDYIVWATGSPRDARQSESPLVQNLLDRGLVSQHPMGGLRVDPRSYKVIDRNGQFAKSLRLVGELSNGEFLFTSAIEILVNHARRCVDHFVDELRKTNTDSPAEDATELA